MGETAQLGVLHGNQTIYLLKETPPRPTALITEVGIRLPAHLTASGRSMLSVLPFKQVLAYFAAPGSFPRLTGSGPSTARELHQLLREDAARGWAIERGAVWEGAPYRAGRPPRQLPGVVGYKFSSNENPFDPDQAYAEFERGDDRIDEADARSRHPNLLVLRTFSKAHGLADLRVGYAVADAGIIDLVRRGAVPFGVSGVAQAAAIASLAHRDQVFARVSRIVAEREHLVGALRTQGWTPPDAQGNFFWLPIGDRAEEFAEAAGRMALAVRTFPGDGVRVSIGERAANERMLELCAGFGAPG